MSRKLDRPIILRLILAFFIATVLFIDLFFLSNVISVMNYKSINEDTNLLKKDVDYMDSALASFSCDDTLLFDVSKKLDSVGGFLGILELRFGKDDPRVLEQKKVYTVLEYRHYQIINKFKDLCGKNFTTIMFFYSNAEEVDEASETASYIISSFKKKSSKWVMVYSFDYNLDSGIIDFIKKDKNMTYAPVVIVDDGRPFALNNIGQLEERIDDVMLDKE